MSLLFLSHRNCCVSSQTTRVSNKLVIAWGVCKQKRSTVVEQNKATTPWHAKKMGLLKVIVQIQLKSQRHLWRT